MNSLRCEMVSNFLNSYINMEKALIVCTTRVKAFRTFINRYCAMLSYPSLLVFPICKRIHQALLSYRMLLLAIEVQLRRLFLN
ncbi:hypothetical protein DI53_3237 [Sphingobacterium deserti]|uniref:Uncharacterized protein n=1 Tax=Sphingobacterium deserti TaxID=1229276 RepID=A0A0B8T6N5_9SPHI|nr:hypothetical protein DI53_3237 [Sphingobacterium deserti]